MDIISLKENIRKYYNLHYNQEVKLRNRQSAKADWKIHVRESFYHAVKEESKRSLLELGAGNGYDSQFFLDKGLSVTAVDISSEMVKACQEKGIEAYELDFYNLASLGKTFDCVYSMNALVHVPKTDLPSVLREIDSVLAPDGLFYIGLWGGRDIETEIVEHEISEVPRFYAFHSESYLNAILADHFEILSFETIDMPLRTEVDTFHSVIMRKKKSDIVPTDHNV
ncbi:MAG: class I SAM-dependent methyltransferase [Oscillospiraceae bacterium]